MSYWAFGWLFLFVCFCLFVVVVLLFLFCCCCLFVCLLFCLCGVVFVFYSGGFPIHLNYSLKQIYLLLKNILSASLNKSINTVVTI